MTDKLKLTVLGSRGSVPVSGPQFNVYGGATSCYMIEAGKNTIFLDAGTGIINAPSIPEENDIYIFLSHPHLDHIIGLPFFPELSKKDRNITFYGKSQGGIPISLLIERAYSPPYWPLNIVEYPSNFCYKDVTYPLKIDDDTEVFGIDVRHPGGNVGLKIVYKGKSIVYLTDYEMDLDADKEIIEFSRNADVLLCDAQYSPAEYEKKKGFGHSSFEEAIMFMEVSESKRLLLVHHDPFRDDYEIFNTEKQIGRENVRFARQNGVLEI